MAEFLSPVEGGQLWASERQNMMLPISLYGEGVMLYKSREWGPLPRELRPVSEDEEAVWVGKLSTAMGREVNISHLGEDTVGGEIVGGEQWTDGIQSGGCQQRG